MAFETAAHQLSLAAMTGEDNRDELVELLTWYGELGVDSAVAEEAVDWLRHGDVAPGADVRQALLPSRTDHSKDRSAANRAREGDAKTFRQPAPSPSVDQRDPGRAARSVASSGDGSLAEPGAAAARRIAARAKSLEDLKAGLEAFEGCALRATAKNTCFFRGAPKARVMIIGEAPGRDEDIEGRPFVGRAGKLLDRMLAALGLGESDVHITNVVYWRPPGNRTPTLQETQSCRPFLERQAQLVEPEFVLLLGGAAAKSLLESAEGIMRLRGKWKDLELGGRKLRAMPTLHPAYLLRTPAAKRQAWRDLLSLRKALDSLK